MYQQCICWKLPLIYFQLFENYHVFKKPELKKSVEKTPLASGIDRKLDAESKVG